MNISEIFIRRPIGTVLIMLSIVGIGLLSYQKLPVGPLPDVDFPSINVTADYPGASPEIMGNNVATPLENEFMSINGVQLITSNSVQGKSTITLQFDIDKDIDKASSDVQAAINRATGNLPTDLPSPPTYEKYNPSQSPVMFFIVKADTIPIAKLYDYAHAYIAQRLNMVEGVSKIKIYGNPYAVRVQMNPALLAQRGIDPSTIPSDLQNASPYIPTGKLYGDYYSRTVRPNGQLTTGAEFNNLILESNEGADLKVSDVGKAYDSVSNKRLYAHYITKDTDNPSIIMGVIKQAGANTVSIAKQIQEILPEIEKSLPASVHLEVFFDQSKTIIEGINDVQFTLFLAFVLVVLVIFFYLGKIVDTIIPSCALPTSIIGTYAVMYLLGYSIDNLSLMALTLSVGFVVDDAIVVLENIVRHSEMGKTPFKAALDATKEISFTVLSMTLSLVAAFIPLLFMPDILGKLFREFSVVLAVSIIISGFVSLTLTPMMASRLVKKKSEVKEGDHYFILWVRKISDKMNDGLLNTYKPLLRWGLSRPKTMLLIGLFNLIFSAALLIGLPKDFMPDTDQGLIQGFAQTFVQSTPEETTKHVKEMNDIIRKHPAVDGFFSIGGYPNDNESTFYVKLIPKEQRKGINEVIEELYIDLKLVPGINPYLKLPALINLNSGSSTQGGAYQFSARSMNQESLFTQSEEMKKRIQNIDGVLTVQSDLEMKSAQLHLDFLREQAASLGVTPGQAENVLKTLYSDSYSTKIKTPIDQYDVITEASPEFAKSHDSLDYIYLKSNTTGEMIPFSNIAEYHLGVGPLAINHYNQFPSVTLSFNVKKDVPLGKVTDKVEEVAKEVFNDSTIANMEGTAQVFQSAFATMGFLLFLAVAIIYVILGILYENLIHPLTIISTLPFAAFGGLFTLFIFGKALSMYAFVGLILLLGIVKKNGIMMVDQAFEIKRTKNLSAKEVIFEAACLRFRPIMMTTMAAIAGALPIAMGFGAQSEARQPLGLVVMGGLVFSQILTLMFTPVIYLYMDKLSQKLAKRWPIFEDTLGKARD
jgi:hydrophobic/amphiphilic exporter-1 (mainly G- bacteria), HAE1 family